MKLKTVIRYFLGIMFLMTGGMKLFLPQFGEAFLLQLTEAGIPWSEFHFWLVPVIELIIGGMLLLNYQTKFALIMIIPLMVAAVYVHAVVVDPAAFPAQPQFPIIPLIVLWMVGYYFLSARIRAVGEVLK